MYECFLYRGISRNTMIKGILNSDLMSTCLGLFIQGCIQKHNDKGDIELRFNVHMCEALYTGVYAETQ